MRDSGRDEVGYLRRLAIRQEKAAAAARSRAMALKRVVALVRSHFDPGPEHPEAVLGAQLTLLALREVLLQHGLPMQNNPGGDRE